MSNCTKNAKICSKFKIQKVDCFHEFKCLSDCSKVEKDNRKTTKPDLKGNSNIKIKNGSLDMIILEGTLLLKAHTHTSIFEEWR